LIEHEGQGLSCHILPLLARQPRTLELVWQIDFCFCF